MKTLIISALVALFTFTGFESYAQNNDDVPQEVTAKQQRQMKRDQKKQARQAANELAFKQAVEALKDQNWVLMATTLYGPRGAALPVSDNTNFIQFKEDKVYVQLAFNGIAGPNGLGGITVEGSPSQIQTKTDKHGNITYSFYVNGIALTAQIVITLQNGNNYAQATVYPMMNSNNLTFSGTLVPTSKSGIFRSGFISY